MTYPVFSFSLKCEFSDVSEDYPLLQMIYYTLHNSKVSDRCEWLCVFLVVSSGHKSTHIHRSCKVSRYYASLGGGQVQKDVENSSHIHCTCEQLSPCENAGVSSDEIVERISDHIGCRNKSSPPCGLTCAV